MHVCQQSGAKINNVNSTSFEQKFMPFPNHMLIEINILLHRKIIPSYWSWSYSNLKASNKVCLTAFIFTIYLYVYQMINKYYT